MEDWDVNQLRNHRDLVAQKVKEDTDLLNTIITKVNELRRQQLLVDFESSENDKLLKRTIETFENVQESSLVSINETNQSIVEFNNKSEDVLNDYKLFGRTVSDMQANNVQIFEDLPNIIGEEAIMKMTTEVDQKLNDTSAVVVEERIKFTGINAEFVQSNKDRKMLTENTSSLTMLLKKSNFTHDIEKK